MFNRFCCFALLGNPLAFLTDGLGLLLIILALRCGQKIFTLTSLQTDHLSKCALQLFHVYVILCPHEAKCLCLSKLLSSTTYRPILPIQFYHFLHLFMFNLLFAANHNTLFVSTLLKRYSMLLSLTCLKKGYY